MKKTTIPRLGCLSIFFVLLACSSEETPPDSAAATAEPAPYQIDDSVDEALSLLELMNIESTEISSVAERVRYGYLSIGRPDQDLVANETRKPDQVLDWVGVEDGMNLIDLAAGGGYYSENLAWAVGLGGSVILQNLPGELDLRGGAGRLALNQRLAENRLPQIVAVELTYAELPGLYSDLDGATFVNAFHDLYNFQGEAAALAALQQIHQILKPGSFLLLIDHQGTSGADNSPLHRIDPAVARDLLQRAGFEIAAESDLLAEPTDNLELSVFDPAVRGKTHRFILKAVKPAN